MTPALIVLWLAQSMSSMTQNQDKDQTHQPIVEALISSDVSPDEIVRYVSERLDSGLQEPDQLLDTLRMYIDSKHQEYLDALESEYRLAKEIASDKTIDGLRKQMVETERLAREKFEQQTGRVLKAIESHETFKKHILAVVKDRYDSVEVTRDFDFCSQFMEESELSYARWQTSVKIDDEETDLIDYQEDAITAKSFDYMFIYRSEKLYTGEFLSQQLSRLREGEGFFADNFVPLLPTVFVLASIVAFSTGTSWGTMGIVMPLVIPLAYSQLATGGAEVTSGNPVLLCCVGSVLAGAIFGDHCSPISDTTVLSSQASGCDHVAHVRTQLPYAILVGLIAIVFGTLPIGYGVPVWFLIPLGIGGMFVSLWFLGSKVEQ